MSCVRSWRTSSAALVLLMLAAAVHAAPPPVANAAVLQVGQVKLHRCTTSAPWCGTLERALDPSGVVPGKIAVYFEYYPHTGVAPAAAPWWRPKAARVSRPPSRARSYLGLFEPLRATHDVVIMDNRGTGRSGAVDCQPTAAMHCPRRPLAPAAACWGRPPRCTARRWPGTTSPPCSMRSAHGPVDLYGDSYGTYFCADLRRAAPGAGCARWCWMAPIPWMAADYAWYPAYAPAMRDKFNCACERSPECSQSPAVPWSTSRPALRRCASSPSRARAHR